jgi:hypothetical protein
LGAVEFVDGASSAVTVAAVPPAYVVPIFSL